MTILAEGVTYEFTKNNELLEQYFAIRKQCFLVELGVNDYPWSREEDDLDEHMLVAIKNGICIGGIRWLPSNVEQRRLLQIEKSGFRVAEALPELQLQNYNYCEFGRLAVTKSERQDGKVVRDLFRLLVDRVRERSMDFFIMEIDKNRDARFRSIFSSFGVEICKQNVHIPSLTYAKPYELALYVTKL